MGKDGIEMNGVIKECFPNTTFKVVCDNGHELLAYLAGDPTLTVLDLRAFLSQSLPEYMLPAAFVILDQLPVNASGKVDRRRLPAPDAAPQAQQGTAFLAPRTDTERALVAVWTQVLGRDRIGIRDHYIALGGDSIKALQIAARLRDAGWKLELSHLFLHPRIEDLAPLLTPVQAAPVDEPATGAAPLAPAQARFFSTFDGDPGWFNQTVLLQSAEPLDPQALRRALDAIYTHHDLLRARFPGRRQQIDPPGAPAPFRIAEGPYNPQQPPRFDLENGPLFQAVLHPDRLLLAAHHLVIDGVSWRILLEDLETAYRGATLPAKTTPFRAWAASLPPVAEAAPIPQDPDPNPTRAADCLTHTISLSRSRTTDVLEPCHEAYGTEGNDILLTALARAWQRHSGDSTIDVLLESHGRQTHNPAHDLSRTIGWFTAMDPVRLDLGTTADPGRHIKLVKETLRETLRARPAAGFTPAPRVVFNYLGQFGGPSGPALFTRAPEDPGPMADPNATFPHDLEINGAAYDGHLEFTFSFHPRRLTASTAARLADAFVEELERLTTHAIGRGTTELTPSDIDYNGFNMDEMDLFLNNLPAEESR